MATRFLLLFVIFICSTNLSSQKDISQLKAELQTTLDNIVTTDNFPGATLAVILPDGKMLSLSSGFEDKELEKSMPIGGQMFTGSTGKIIVSAVALQLVSEGKINLEDKVSKYFSETAWYAKVPNANDLTIKSLMSHTSGLPRYIFLDKFMNAVKADLWKSWTAEERLAVILDMPAVHEVGKGWYYSDTNYILLGMILEQVTGKTFYELAATRILEPLKLKNTYPSTQPELPGLVQGHIGESNFFGLPKKTVEDGRYVMNPQFEWTGGGFITNVEDLAVLVKNLHEGKVLSEEIYDEFIKAHDFKTGQPAEMGYGLGTFVWQTDLGQFLGHAGVMPGYLTQVEYAPKYGIAIAFQVNTDEGMGRKHHGHVQEVAKVVLGHL